VPTFLLLQYGDAEYWDHRYQAEPVFFDWYLDFGGLQLIKQHVPVDASILQVRCGRWFSGPEILLRSVKALQAAVLLD
jgi:hypothetical protein